VKLRKRTAVLIAAAVTGLGLLTAIPASAVTQPEVCENQPPQQGALCINNWNGANGIVNMYQPGVTNDAFRLELIDPCNSNPPNTVTGTCPFNVGSGMNSRYLGNFIFRVRDVNHGFCVGTAGQGEGWEGSCGNANGAGARIGVILIQGNGAFYYVSRYWSNQFNRPSGWVSPHASGANLITWQNADTGLTAWDHGFL